MLTGVWPRAALRGAGIADGICSRENVRTVFFPSVHFFFLKF